MRLLRLALGILLLQLVTGTALAAETGKAAAPTAVFFAEIVVLLVVGRMLGEAAHRCGLPAVMGQLVGGVLLGPSLLGLVWPAGQAALFPPAADRQMLEGVAQLGVLLLLLLTGMETDFALVRKAKRTAIAVSLCGIAIPFALGGVLGLAVPAELLPHPEKRLVAALFLGTALSISSVKILAMVIRDLGFIRRNLGQVMLSAAIIDDTIGWVTIGIVLGIAQRGHVDIGALAGSVAGTALFLALSFTIARRLVFWLIRYSNDHFESEFPVVTTILVVTCLMALATEAIGVHTVLGAFVAGVIVGQSPILTRHIDEQLRGLISAVFAPIFFGLAGVSADLTVLANPRTLLLTLGLILVASVGKFSGAFIGGRIGGLTAREALALGCGMNARGSTEVIVASIGLATGALSRDLYTMIVTMAVLTTLAMPPTLRWAMRSLPMSEEEKRRLDREALEARSFVPSIERVLFVADRSANGRLAARLAGLLTRLRQIPTSVLPVDAPLVPSLESAADEVGLAEEVRGAAMAGSAKEDDGNPHAIDVLPAPRREEAGGEVARQARKGFDLMVVGVADAAGRDGAIGPHASELTIGFAGPVITVIAAGGLESDPRHHAFRILAAVKGTANSRHGAEVAIELARASGATLVALHVPEDEAQPKPKLFQAAWRQMIGDKATTAVVQEVIEIARSYDVVVRPERARSQKPADAIRAAVKARNATLIVMGVNPRLEETLNYGAVVANLIRDPPCALLLVASQAASTKEPREK